MVVALVLMSLLSALAYASHTQHIERQQRLHARTALWQVVQQLEHWHARHGRYPPATELDLSAWQNRGYVLSWELGQVAGQRYRVQALASRPLTCYRLTLDQAGVKEAFDAAGHPQAACWD